MTPTSEEHIRQAALDIALNADASDLTVERVALRAKVTVAEVTAFSPTDGSLIRFMLKPLWETADEHLKRIPIHQHPTPAQQRETLDALIVAAIAHRPQIALIVRVATSATMTPEQRRADRFAYQAGVRLLGSDYEANSDSMTRVYFVTDLLCMAICAGRHRYEDPHYRDLLLSCAVNALSPTTLPPTSGLSRRWTDPDAP